MKQVKQWALDVWARAKQGFHRAVEWTKQRYARVSERVKELYQDFLYVPKHGKVRDKVLITRIATSVCVILVCTIAMSVTAYAYFANSMSLSTRIKSATYAIEVEAPQGVTETNGIYAVTSDGSPITFTLTKSTDSTAKVGYAAITVTVNGTSQTFYTEPIGTYAVGGAATTVDSRAIILDLPSGTDATVKVMAQWGSCAYPPITSNTIVLDQTVTTTTTTTKVTTTTTTTASITTTTTAATTTTTTVAETTTAVTTTTTAAVTE